MKRAGRCLRFCHLAVVVVLVLCTSVLNIHIATVAAAEKMADGKVASASTNTENTAQVAAVPEKDDESARDVAAQYQAAAITQQGKTPEPQSTKTNSGGHTLLYAGIGIAAVAAVAAVAAGSGGSSSSDSEEEAEPEPTVSPVGADLNGTNWHGRLILVDSGFKEDVTATVLQNGSELEITTSSAQKYGKKFIGKINSSASITVRDQDTGQDWTTHFSSARWNMIDLYDYVHNYEDLDRLYLTREAKQ